MEWNKLFLSKYTLSLIALQIFLHLKTVPSSWQCKIFERNLNCNYESWLVFIGSFDKLPPADKQFIIKLEKKKAK